MCILFVYTLLLQVVSHNGLSVLSMSVVGFQMLMGELYPFFWNFFNCKAPNSLTFHYIVNIYITQLSSAN